MYVSINHDSVIRAASNTLVKIQNLRTIATSELDEFDKKELINKRLVIGPPKKSEDLKIAVICNWGDRCGIATYAKYLVDALRPKVGQVRIFAEHILDSTDQDEAEGVVRCWTRGESMVNATSTVLAWEPDLVMIQHEFGLFPRATHFLKMLEMLDKTPYVIALHSVYQHLDKTICTAYIKNAIVHSKQAKQVLEDLGHLNPISVVGHGCVVCNDVQELWNIFHNNYVVIQFGFGFNYKGVDQAIDAIAHLKAHDSKFKNIFYCYCCSENPHTRAVHADYYNYLKNKVDAAELQDNVVILRGFLSEKIVKNFLRTAKLAIFPYRNDPNNTVYAASGAIRHAMANEIPVVASDSHLFDDLEGVVPRAADYLQLAAEIDHIFSDDGYRKSLIEKNKEFIRNNTWDTAAEGYLSVFKSILQDAEGDRIHVCSFTDVS